MAGHALEGLERVAVAFGAILVDPVVDPDISPEIGALHHEVSGRCPEVLNPRQYKMGEQLREQLLSSGKCAVGKGAHSRGVHVSRAAVARLHGRRVARPSASHGGDGIYI